MVWFFVTEKKDAYARRKSIDSPFDSGRMRGRVDFLERSYKIDFDRNVPRPAKAG
jgi:hypothetical protein